MKSRIVRSAVLVAVLALGTAGCYHATVDTGRAPNGVVVQKNWAHSFINGLVPPSTVETASQCPNGVAKVETQLSFLNMLASFLTAGIYTPMTITVQCAGSTAQLGPDAKVIGVASLGELNGAFNQALEVSRESGAAVYVDFSGAE